MEQDVPPHSNKKIILLAIGAIGLTFLFLVIAIFAVNSSTNSNTTAPSEEAVDNSAGEQPVNADGELVPSSTKVQDGFEVYKNADYSINYPSDWQLDELNLTEGIRGISLKPAVDLGSSSNAVLTVTVSDPAVQKIKQSEQTYTKLGFKSSSVNINNVRASKLYGTLPPKTASSSAQTKFIQTGYIFLGDGGNNYFFDYSYVNLNIDTGLENTMDKIISSFKPI